MGFNSAFKGLNCDGEIISDDDDDDGDDDDTTR